MSTTSAMAETSMDAIETIFKDIRESFNNGKTKPISWRKKQIEQIYKMCDEQKDAFAAAVNADFHRPNNETLLFDCGSVSFFLNHFLHLTSFI
jgi:acyl-CoA reductase-like NAD-dependent aldehyde dehydrogenase